MPTNQNTTVSQADSKAVASTMRFPEGVWLALKFQAARQKTPVQRIVIDAVCQFLSIDESGEPLTDASMAEKKKSTRQSAA